MDPLVEKIVRTIVRAVKPDRVILFGSRASGKSQPDSDIDLLVVYSGKKSKHDVQIEIHKLFRHPGFSMDLFVMTPEELESQKRIANTLAREASERGVVCYG
jgi:predicted nucleotidyltransferase